MQLELFDGIKDNLSGLIALEDVFKAYYECRRSKRRTVNALAFELDFEREVVRLWQDINAGRYRIGRSIAFIVKLPVQREVFAADFRDRVVHHLLISKLNPLFEKEFIDSSYSCRDGKGTLYGVRDVQAKIAECSEGYSRDCYILKLDIRSFFMCIDKNVLYRMLFMFINEKYREPDRPIVLNLVKQVIFNNPENNCVIKGRQSDWNGLPFYKSLFWSSEHCGLPIGNLTSQIFANFYLNRLDKYVIDELGIKHYGRYVDDFVLIHPSREVLVEARQKIQEFLRKYLKLELHPQKFYLQHYSKGVRFIGAFIKPNRIYIGTRTKTNLYQKIYDFLPQMAKSVDDTLERLEEFSSCVNSYLGFMRHYNTYNLRSKILKTIDQSFLGEITEMSPQADKLSFNKMFRPAKQKQRQLSKQRQYRRTRQQKHRKGGKNGFIQPTSHL